MTRVILVVSFCVMLISCNKPVFTKLETREEAERNKSIIADYRVVEESLEKIANDSLKAYLRSHDVFLQKMQFFYGKDNFRYSDEYYLNDQVIFDLIDHFDTRFSVVKTANDTLRLNHGQGGNQVFEIEYVPDYIQFLDKEGKNSFRAVLIKDYSL